MGLLLAAGAEAQQVVVDPCGVSNVTVAGAANAEYFEDVDELLGITRPPAVNAWLPYGVALTNRARQNIVAVAVRWLVTNGKGQEIPFTVSTTMFEQPRQQVTPGRSVIAVPVAVLDASRRAAASLGHLTDFRNAQHVRVALDGVVFASGQFVGPNSGKAYEEFVAETTVPAHVASTVLAMKDAGEAIGTVAAWLETNSKPQSASRTAQVTARTARILLADYKRGGETLMYEVAQGYERGSSFRLYR